MMLVPSVPRRPAGAAVALAATLLAACGGGGQTPSPRGATARATFVTAQGQPAGTATLTSTDDGVFVSAQLRGLPEGTHGFHIHQVGRCDPPFESAGGHFNPTEREHGYLNPRGEHLGDMPNITVRSDGTAAADHHAVGVTLTGGDRALLDGDGSALVVHAGVDDYRSDPAGNAGPRIACGVIERERPLPGAAGSPVAPGRAGLHGGARHAGAHPEPRPPCSSVVRRAALRSAPRTPSRRPSRSSSPRRPPARSRRPPPPPPPTGPPTSARSPRS